MKRKEKRRGREQRREKGREGQGETREQPGRVGGSWEVSKERKKREV